MAPHLSGKEQDMLMEWKRKSCTPIEIHAKLLKARGKKGIQVPDFTVVPKLLRGKTHRRGDFGLQARSKSYFRTGKSIHALRKPGAYTSWHLPLGHSPLGLLLLGLLPHGLLPPSGRRCSVSQVVGSRLFGSWVFGSQLLRQGFCLYLGKPPGGVTASIV